ncbi:MAG: DNA polymerase III subunit beta [Oscillospiraceae bacterium]|nr:DNA polymerase III subunit beta [Oscillospiraceae bacterium]
MKFTADRNKLSDAIINASKVTSAHSSIPALEGILVNLKNEKITVTGYDLDSGIKNIIPVISAEEDGEVVLNAKLIAEMLRKMPAGCPVEMTCENETNVTIKCGPVEFKLVGVSGQNYPNLPEMSLETSFQVKENVLKSMIRQTIYAVAQNDLKPILTGVFFEVKDNVFSMVAVDGVRIAMRNEKVNYKDLSFVVPTKVLNELLRILSDEDTGKDITVLIDKSQVGFNRDDYITFTRLMDGDFIDYRRYTNFVPTSEAVVNARQFAASLDRVLLLTERFKSPVRCIFENNKLTVTCNTNLGSIHEEIKADYPYPKLEIAFNARFMMDAMRNSECDEVKLQFTGPLSPIKIVPVSGEDFTYLVVPVKMKS